MKAKLFFQVLLFLTIPILSIGQTVIPECTTPHTSPDLEVMENIRIPDNSNIDYYLKVYVHVLSHTDKGPGQTNMGINESMRRLYNEFDSKGIYLVWDGNVDYILNDDWYDVPEDYICVDYTDDWIDDCPNDGIFDYNYHTDGIDIYLGSSLNQFAIGQAYSIAGKSEFIVGGYTKPEIDSDDIDFWPQSPVIVHEMGHVLYLYHTYWQTFGDSPGTCDECAEPNSNQWLCGDYIYDTPPDPKYGAPDEEEDNCQFMGSGNDACGVPYAPLTDNYMSSAYLDCRTSFTDGQVRRMKNAIELLPVLQSTHLQDYTYIRGNSIVCVFGEYSVYSNDTNNLIIEDSGNITVNITNTTSTQIDFELINYDQSDPEGQPVWISIKRNGNELVRKDIWKGKPQAVTPASIFGATDVYIDDEEDYAISTQLEGTSTRKDTASYFWKLPGFNPEENYPFENNFGEWQMNYLTKYNFVAKTKIGECSGEIKLYGINECGDGAILADDDGLDVHVNGGGSNCPPDGEPLEIVYYPNPADDLLNIDLSLQDYKIFDIVVYNDNQVAVYTDQSTNVVKTIDTFNLTNDTYYLHIYDGSEIILSKLLVMNH